MAGSVPRGEGTHHGAEPHSNRLKPDGQEIWGYAAARQALARRSRAYPRSLA